MTILELAMYSPEVLTSFGESLLTLGKKLKEKGDKMVVCFPQSKDWMHIFEAEGFPVEIIHIRNIFDIRAVKLILDVFKKYKVDVVHTHFCLEPQIIACIAKLLSHKKVKVMWHWRSLPGTDAMLLETEGIYRILLKIKRKFGNLLYRMFDRLVSIHITVSEEIRNILLTRKITRPSKIKVIYNGIPLNKYTSIHYSTTPLLHHSIKIGNISNFRWEKDHFTFLRAVKLVLEKHPEVKFILVGDGPTRMKVEKYANQLNIQKNLIFTGMQKDVTEFINSCDFIVFSSFHEGFPNVPCESLALKKPVIATKVGAIPLVVKEGETGFLTPRKDATNMASRIIYLIEHPEEIKRLGENGRKLIEQKFTTERWSQQIMAIFQENEDFNSN